MLNRTASQDGDVQHRKPMPSPEGDPDYWLLHIDSAANIIWETTFGSDGEQYPTGFCRGADGSLWCMGHTSGLFTPNNDILDLYGNTDGWVVHTDTLGNLINQRTLGADDQNRLNFIHPLPDGSVLIGGYYYSTFTPGSGNPGFPAFNEGDADIFIARLGPGSVSVDDTNIHEPEWKLYPNPVREELTVSVEGDIKNLSLVITDAAGKRVHRQAISGHKTKVATTAFAPGIYYISLHDASGFGSTKKIIVKH